MNVPPFDSASDFAHSESRAPSATTPDDSFRSADRQRTRFALPPSLSPGLLRNYNNATDDKCMSSHKQPHVEDLASWAFEDDARDEPFFFDGVLVEPKTELETLMKITFVTLPLSEGDGTASYSHAAHYRSTDALSLIGENTLAQSRGHVFAIILDGDNAATFVPYGSLVNIQSYAMRSHGDDLAQSNGAEGVQPHISVRFWIALPIASDSDHVTFADVPRGSVMCFPFLGLLYTGASILDMPLPAIQFVRGYSRAIINHFRSLKQLHLVGDKKACKALRRQLNGTLPEETGNAGSTATLPDHSDATTCGVTCSSIQANFEIFVLGMMDLGSDFGMVDLQCSKLSFSSIVPGICDLEVFVSKTLFLKNLTEVQLLDMSLGPDGAAVVAKLLSRDSSHHLTYISLTRNPLKDEGCACICDNLADNTSLTKLSLGNVNATSITAHNISRLLLSNSAIRSIALYDNLIEEDGFVSMFNALQINTSLTWLSFQDCPKFDAVCAAKLIHLLRSNTQLVHVGVSGNPTGRDLDQEITCMYVRSQPFEIALPFYTLPLHF
jgi:hypothetical protein